MNKTKRIWNDPVLSKLISTFLIFISTSIYSFIKSKIDDQSFIDTLKETIISPVFLYVVIFFLILYIIIDKFVGANLKEVQSDENTEGVFKWENIEAGVKDLREQLISDNYVPTLLVGVGRGGAIISSLLSGNMIKAKHIPFIALERKYNEERGMRKASLFDDVVFKKDLDRVLLVAGDVYTGDTAKVFIEFLEGLGAKEIRFLVFAKVNSTNMKPNYFYASTNVVKLKFPWMLSNTYLTDARTN